jgi:hypothetical protein
MGCREDSRSDAGAAPEVAPREWVFAGGGLESEDERDVIEPRRRCLTNEVPGVSNV